ncbi:hypothetical protein ACOI1A_12760 [Corynebacterium glutamicum]|uniref:hypothetical protein n=2 Tax=Corynebacteriaceae TaxID=1653 RepID=UPI0012D2CC3B|nr:hypothetical protein [Corynebacterium glutamicum]QXU46088.1 hypothetical protein KW808_01795 [[Brevibacterium] flavum]QYR17839.1 hypothetical protein JJQ73_01805 [Corynebacterium glutamicum]
MTVWNNINNYHAQEWVEMTGLPVQTYWDMVNASYALIGSYAGSIMLSLSAGTGYYY